MTYGVLDKEGAVFIQQFKKMECKLADLARIWLCIALHFSLSLIQSAYGEVCQDTETCFKKNLTSPTLWTG